MVGLGIVMTLSIRGTSEAATLIITSTTMYVRKRNVLVSSYITSSFSTTIFLFGLIIGCMVISGLGKEITLKDGFSNFVACASYGVVSSFGGSAMGAIAKKSFPALVIEKRFFLVFFLMVTIVEVMLVFSFMLSFTHRA